jgi:hypothetical protein
MPQATNFSIQLNDEMLRALFFEWITRNLDATEAAPACDPEIAKAFSSMRSLAPAGIRKIAQHAKNCMSITIDRRAFAAAIYSAAADSQRADNLQFLLENGATRSMIADVLAVSDQRIDRQRDLLGAIPNSRGRPRMPSAAEREAIQQSWAGIPSTIPVEKYRHLRELFPRWSLASLSATVNEFETKTAKNRKSVENTQVNMW